MLGLGCIRRETAISLLGGRPLAAIYRQRMGLEPQLPRFGPSDLFAPLTTTPARRRSDEPHDGAHGTTAR